MLVWPCKHIYFFGGIMLQASLVVFGLRDEFVSSRSLCARAILHSPRSIGIYRGALVSRNTGSPVSQESYRSDWGYAWKGLTLAHQEDTQVTRYTGKK
jgi:hypothetical protein